jgi:hypothetical protein
MKRGSLLALVLMGLTAIQVSALAGCGQSPTGAPAGDLTYSVKPREGGLIAKVADNRVGEHTVWVVLLNPPKGRHREWYASFNHGDLRENESQSTSGNGPLPAGTYSYAVYDADGIIYGSGARYWTPEYRLGGGKVTVP